MGLSILIRTFILFVTTISAVPLLEERQGTVGMYNSNCRGYYSQIELAIQNAKDLAQYARDNTNADIWKAFFNRNDEDLCKVKEIFDAVMKFDGSNTNTIINCDVQGTTDTCQVNSRGGDAGSITGGVPAYVLSGPHGVFSITLCPGFFQLPDVADWQCQTPQKSWRSITDRGGTMLHEMLHVDNLFRKLPFTWDHIGDGPGAGQCYYTADIMGTAKGNMSPRCTDLLTTAAAYGWYAYAARAVNAPACGGAGHPSAAFDQCDANQKYTPPPAGGN